MADTDKPKCYTKSCNNTAIKDMAFCSKCNTAQWNAGKTYAGTSSHAASLASYKSALAALPECAPSKVVWAIRDQIVFHSGILDMIRDDAYSYDTRNGQ